MFNRLIRDGAIVFDQERGKSGHHDSVLEMPTLDFKRFKKILDHDFLKSCAKNR